MALEAVGSSPTTHPIIYNRIGYPDEDMLLMGRSQVGKARDFDSRMRRFESCRPSHTNRGFHRVLENAGVAELADALDLGSSAFRRGSSNLFARTKLKISG